MKSGNGIPSRCVYLEEMAVDLEDQDWLDMNNIEQVASTCSSGVPSAEASRALSLLTFLWRGLALLHLCVVRDVPLLVSS